MVAERGANAYFAAVGRMPKVQRYAGEQQAVAAELLLEEAVVAAATIGRITDDGMGDVLQVAAQLVAAPAVRFERHEAVARSWVAFDCIG